MTTKAEAAKADASKKGTSPKQRRKNAQRRRTAPTLATAVKAKRAARVKPDSSREIVAEQAASSPEARASRAQAKDARVRSSGTR